MNMHKELTFSLINRKKKKEEKKSSIKSRKDEKTYTIKESINQIDAIHDNNSSVTSGFSLEGTRVIILLEVHRPLEHPGMLFNIKNFPSIFAISDP